MIPFEEALRIIASQPLSGGTEEISFSESLGKVLAEGVFSDMDMPPFDKSAMDGYACRSKDAHQPMVVIEEIPAGKMPQLSLAPGTCSRIFTGAPLPVGADCVLMDEEVKLDEEGRVVFLKKETKPNICYRGEDVKAGTLLIAPGTLIRPEHIAIMASAGAVRVKTALLPLIGVFSTGNELTEPSVKPEGSQIRNSNGFQVVAQLQQAGFPAEYLGIIPDRAEDTEYAVRGALVYKDIVVLTGGVSMGDYDFVPEVMERCGVEILFHHLAVQPGKPSLFGKTRNNRYVFGLPGNPVSSFIQTELLVKLLCYRIQGHTPDIPRIMLPMGVTYGRKRATRKSFIPVRIADSKVFPVEYHGSAHIQALNGVHGIIAMDPGQEFIAEGEAVHVRLF
ncbi:MAG TPA: molybdopterin molybdotransferase MoeA [Bacteroidales bacterium]|nr:molybdopterin molybdotransferase MoeA [Bacteroidales bacterium]HRZ49438.1 molybdopterin molybdotransferase MoeA [Bacteroidales bacterium]